MTPGDELPPELAKLVDEREEEVSFGVHELGNDIDREALPENVFWVIGKTALRASVMVESDGSNPKVLLLPLREFRLRYEGPREGVAAILWWMSTRIRSYVAF